jgi:hypothetical protein
MTDLSSQVMVIGGLALAAAILYAAWHEYAGENRRDAQFLAVVGTASLMGSVAAWLQ